MKPTLKYSIIIAALFIVAASNLVLAQEESSQPQNRGVIECHSVPETKKGTVIFDGDTQASQGQTSESEEGLSELQKQARAYRKEGLDMQNLGNLESALTFYQKAVQLDPGYAVAYNDLGIIYETAGAVDLAEENYLKAVNINPNYLSAYSNLALLYENKRDLARAAYYWRRRADLGFADDPWTEQALRRLKDIQAVQAPAARPAISREQDVISLTKDVLNRKSLEQSSPRELARTHLEKARMYEQKNDDLAALKEAIDAQILDPSNKEIEAFVEKTQRRLLSK